MTIPKAFADDPFLTAKDITEITGLSRSATYSKISREMRVYRFGKRVLVRQSDFHKWLDSQVREPSGEYTLINK